MRASVVFTMKRGIPALISLACVAYRAARLRVGGRAQLVDLRPHQVQGARAARPRQVGQARLGRPYCHEALHLKEKAQHAGYKALVEKWDTDSDSSDGSDDELDLAV